MLLVDADDAERRQRREDGRARADDDRRLAGDDPLALVAPLGLGEAGVEHRDAVAEARAEAAERLRRQRDLRHEHDRAAPRASAASHARMYTSVLPLPVAPCEENVAAAAREQLSMRASARSCVSESCSGGGLGAAGPPRRHLAPLAAALRLCGATSASARAGVEP